MQVDKVRQRGWKFVAVRNRVLLNGLRSQTLQRREPRHVDELVNRLRAQHVGKSLSIAVDRVEVNAALEQRLHER